MPACPAGGLLIKTEASGLCSGELMAWYMDQKAPHVLGHEVAGKVVESQDDRFAVGARVAPHHHAPCLKCDFCLAKQFVHCALWKSTKLEPGGMAEYFTISPDLLLDCHLANDLEACDAALVEPVACVMKSRRRARWRPTDRTAVIGLGVMGLIHLLSCPGAIGFERNPARAARGISLGFEVRSDESGAGEFDLIFMCPGSQDVLDLALTLAAPGARILQFAPMPGAHLDLNAIYFRDLELIQSYSCGPDDTTQAIREIRLTQVIAKDVVSDFIKLSDLPQAYQDMKAGKILKPMVIFD